MAAAPQVTSSPLTAAATPGLPLNALDTPERAAVLVSSGQAPALPPASHPESAPLHCCQQTCPLEGCLLRSAFRPVLLSWRAWILVCSAVRSLGSATCPGLSPSAAPPGPRAWARQALPPQARPPHLPVQVPQAVVEEAAGEAAEAQVGAEACGAGQQRGGVHAGPLVVGNPGLRRERAKKARPGRQRREDEAPGSSGMCLRPPS